MRAESSAVVLGAGANGLGIARSLANAGVRTWLVDADARCPEMRTRAARCLPVASLHGDTLIEELVRLEREHFHGSRPVLFLTREDSVQTVSQHREQLLDLYRFSLPASVTVDALTHKQGFQRIAEQLDAPIPPLVHIRASADMVLLEKLRYPVVVKPGSRHADYARHFRKAYRVNSAAEAAQLVSRILEVMADIVVQEWIEGPDDSIHFCLQYRSKDGTSVASFTGRKLRSWPPQVGGTASCTVAPQAHAQLVRLTNRFFADAGVIGMASMEYKRDVRSGEFRMVEPTIGRSDYQEEVATLNGVNVPYAAWCAETGLAFPEPVPTHRPVVWRVRSEDVQSAAAQDQPIAQGRPANARVVDAMLRWRDPMPALVQLLRHARRWVRARSMQRNPLRAEGGKS